MSTYERTFTEASEEYSLEGDAWYAALSVRNRQIIDGFEAGISRIAGGEHIEDQQLLDCIETSVQAARSDGMLVSTDEAIAFLRPPTELMSQEDLERSRGSVQSVAQPSAYDVYIQTAFDACDQAGVSLHTLGKDKLDVFEQFANSYFMGVSRDVSNELKENQYKDAIFSEAVDLLIGRDAKTVRADAASVASEELVGIVYALEELKDMVVGDVEAETIMSGRKGLKNAISQQRLHRALGEYNRRAAELLERVSGLSDETVMQEYFLGIVGTTVRDGIEELGLKVYGEKPSDDQADVPYDNLDGSRVQWPLETARKAVQAETLELLYASDSPVAELITENTSPDRAYDRERQVATYADSLRTPQGLAGVPAFSLRYIRG